MARTSPDELQRLVQSLVETFDAHLEVVRRDVAAQQEAMVHEVRSLHEATIRAMAELRAAVHRVELALHDQFAALEPTPAAGLARPHMGGAPSHAAPSSPAAATAAVRPVAEVRPVPRTQRAATRPAADTAAVAEAPAVATPAVRSTTPDTSEAPAAPVAKAPEVGSHAPEAPVIPTLAERHVVMPPPEPAPAPEAAPASSPGAGLDVDRLVAMLESRLGEIDMTSGTPPATPTA